MEEAENKGCGGLEEREGEKVDGRESVRVRRMGEREKEIKEKVLGRMRRRGRRIRIRNRRRREGSK